MSTAAFNRMSSDSPDPEQVEQAKQQIRGLVNEIAQLAKADLSLVDFYGEFLNRVVAALAAVGGAVWTPGENGGLELQYQINLQETKLGDSQDDQVRHGRLLLAAIQQGEGLLVPPRSGTGENNEAGNPTDYLLVVGPLKSDKKTEGVVEIFQRPGGRPNTQRGYLRFLLQMCELAGEYLKTRQLRHFTDRQALWSQLENFTRASHASLDPRVTAYTIANEGRRLIECDRVSVAIMRGGKCKIEAISGQDTFDKRSNTVYLLNRLTTAVVRSGDAVWYTGDTSDMPPQVEEAVQEYVDESHSKTVAIIPLKRQVTSLDEKAPEEGEAIGALVVEQIEDARPREGMRQRVDVVSHHTSLALTNALDYNGLFLMPVWRTLGKATWVVKARTLPKTLAVLAGVAAIVCALVFIPKDFKLEAKGELQPSVRRDVFSINEGIVIELRKKHGDLVNQDEIVAVLESTDFKVKVQEVEQQRNATLEQLAAVDRELLNRALTAEYRSRYSVQRAELVKTLEGYDKLLELYEKKKQEFEVKSPIRGRVMTWNLEELLNKRTVMPGQVLMTVADETQDWELEIKMPEDRMGFITEARLDWESAARVPDRVKSTQDRLSRDIEQWKSRPELKVPKEEIQRAETELAELNKAYAAYQKGAADAKREPALRAELAPRLDGLPVDFVLATEPGTTHQGYVREIEALAQAKEQEGNVVTIRVAIDKYDPGLIQAGAVVSAKVHCGTTSIGYYYLHDLISWVQRMWFKL